MNTLERHPELWLPVASSIWTVLVLCWWAGKGGYSSNYFFTVTGLGLTLAMWWVLFATGGDDWSWQYKVLAGWYLLAAGTNVYGIARGPRWEAFTPGSAFAGSLFVLGILSLWFAGAA